MKFFIEQVAIAPRDPERAIALLTAIGMDEWARDIVSAKGHVMGSKSIDYNKARLAFNYQATRPDGKALEFEVLNYQEGNNWMRFNDFSVSHLGMHCTAEELAGWREKFKELGISIAQEGDTYLHTNPVIKDSRLYTYVIFNTRDILGVDLKFIVRRPVEGAPA